MEIEYKGANCLVLKTKSAEIVIDPKLSAVGLKDVKGKAEAQLLTQVEFGLTDPELLTLEGPGEYEVHGLSIRGVPARRHIDAESEGLRTTMYRIDSGEVSLGILGHIAPELSDDQAETLGLIDILVVPVGGNGYTLDAHAAVQIIRQIEPKVVVPVHYADKSIAYEVPQAELEVFTKELGVPVETMPKLKIKGGILPEALTVYEITRTA